jgi:hypothetical protein
MRILIAVPTFENIEPETFKAITEIRTEHELIFDFVRGYDCAIARNKIAKKAIEGEFDYVLMIDSDVIVPSDIVDKLLEKPVAICAGVYPRKRTESRETELFKFTEKDYLDRFTFDELDEGRIPVKGAGFGCVLINTNLFKLMPYPWFKYVEYDNGDVLSEELYFCDIARKNGFSIEADSRVRCWHVVKVYQYE